jgi:hypothetical protein
MSSMSARKSVPGVIAFVLITSAFGLIVGCAFLFPPPSDGTETGACCAADGTCSVMTQTDCESAGGTYQGDGSSCSPNPCTTPAATGACCATDGTCSVATQADCESAGGTYQGDETSCSPNPCTTPAATGACCATDGTCSVTTESDCESAGGTYQGDDTSCSPNPCETAPDGATLYADNCSDCHGDDGSGQVGPNIIGSSAAELTAGLSSAIHGSISLTEAEIAAIASFLGG